LLLVGPEGLCYFTKKFVMKKWLITVKSSLMFFGSMSYQAIRSLVYNSLENQKYDKIIPWEVDLKYGKNKKKLV
jgi:hypothetical protein